MVAHSEGTTQILVGMSNDSQWYSDNIATAVLMSPATYTTEKYVQSVYTNSHWTCLRNNNIYVFAGPDWANQKTTMH